MFQVAVLMIMIRSLWASFHDLKVEIDGWKRAEKIVILIFVICMRTIAIFIICLGIVFVQFLKVIWNFK